jgi:hypothetical protein
MGAPIKIIWKELQDSFNQKEGEDLAGYAIHEAFYAGEIGIISIMK